MEALKAKGIEIGSNIRQTKDIWARDYMPIQIDENKLIHPGLSCKSSGYE